MNALRELFQVCVFGGVGGQGREWGGRVSEQDQGIETGLKAPSIPLPVRVTGACSCVFMVPLTIPGAKDLRQGWAWQ